jgi:hypothetical protein
MPISRWSGFIWLRTGKRRDLFCRNYELLVSIRSLEFLDCLSNYRPLKKRSAPQSKFRSSLMPPSSGRRNVALPDYMAQQPRTQPSSTVSKVTMVSNTIVATNAIRSHCCNNVNKGYCCNNVVKDVTDGRTPNDPPDGLRLR